MIQKATNITVHGEIDRLGYLEYYENVKRDFIELKDQYPFSSLLFPPTIKPEKAEIKMIAAHKDKIRLFKGFECEYIKEEMEYYKYLKEELGYTFLILGQHCAGEHGEVNCFDMKNGYEMRKYADSVCAGLETGEFMLLAHPDVVFTKYPVLWDADCDKAFAQIFKTCEKLKIPVEINTNGLRGDRGYPSRECMTFSKDYDLKYLIGSDCHDPRHMHDEWENRAVSWAKEIGIAVEELYPWKDRLQNG